MPVAIATPTYSLTNAAGTTWGLNVLDDEGCAWIVEDEDGWSSSASVRATYEDKTLGDGAWSAPGAWGSRSITLSGHCVAPSREAMLRAKDRAKAAVSVRDLTALSVAEAHMTRYADVRLTDKIDIKDDGSVAFTWTLPLTAADPRRYGAPVPSEAGLPYRGPIEGYTFSRTFPYRFQTTAYDPGSSGRIFFPQAGDFDRTPAKFTIHGPIIRPSIGHLQSGRTLTFDLELDWTSYLDVDLGNGSVLLNGQSSRANTLVDGSAWFLLVPGLNEILFGGAPGTSPGGLDPEPAARLRMLAAPAWY
ncbi:hypothetical protein GCM10022221_68670 [Actinocorallia aurea]